VVVLLGRTPSTLLTRREEEEEEEKEEEEEEEDAGRVWSKFLHYFFLFTSYQLSSLPTCVHSMLVR
jgi:hypothetical protein